METLSNSNAHKRTKRDRRKRDREIVAMIFGCVAMHFRCHFSRFCRVFRLVTIRPQDPQTRRLSMAIGTFWSAMFSSVQLRIVPSTIFLRKVFCWFATVARGRCCCCRPLCHYERYFQTISFEPSMQYVT